MHRSHEYLSKVAMEVSDGLLVYSLLGAVKPGDIPAQVRSEAIRVLIEKCSVVNNLVQAGYRLDMRYDRLGEALLDALFRPNHGCSHLTVGSHDA